MIESYLTSMDSKASSETANDIEISPFVKSMRTEVNIPEDLDEKAVILSDLFEKYKGMTDCFWLNPILFAGKI